MENLPAIPSVFRKLLKLEKIEPRHLQQFSPKLRNNFLDFLCDELFKLKGEARDAFYEKTCAVLNTTAIGEYNFAIIMADIESTVRRTGCIPPAGNIAESTGLSRKTVHKYLRNYKMTETFSDRNNALVAMAQRVAAKLAQQAMNGDTRAAKMYLDYVKNSLPAETSSANQNNYIQLNKTIINQQVIQQLSPEQQQLIEKIISASGKGNDKDDNEEMTKLDNK
jgi:predicted transcriptional regulator